MKKIILVPILLCFLASITTVNAQQSVARQWNEVLLDAIRNDLARPTVHARNLFHISTAMFDAWAAYDEQATPFFLGNNVGGYTTPFIGMPEPDDLQAAREEAISFAAYRLILNRFANSPGDSLTIAAANNLMTSLGYDTGNTSFDYTNGSAAGLGNYIAVALINFGFQDNSNQLGDYNNQYYEPLNPPLITEFPGTSGLLDFNRWQPLTLEVFIDQSGNVIPLSTPEFLGAEWGEVTPFALDTSDLEIYSRDGNDYWVYHDPGTPPYLNPSDSTSYSDEYIWGFSLVSIWQSHLDTADHTIWDISPGNSGNNLFYPDSITEFPDFYNQLQGGDPGEGHDINPVTGQAYEPNNVLRADYARVLAEFWADGPSSETPPGHWFTILNYVNDHPVFEKRYKGEGEIIDDLEWDVKAYFMLGGAMHDCAITAWGIKGWYDYIRPISAIRGMGEKGQSSDPNLPSFDSLGFKLIPGFIELVGEGDPLVGPNNEHLDKIKLYSWRGHDFINNTDTDEAGVGWILAENWWPYQRPSFVTPNFAGYISGHSTYSRAAAEVMTFLTGDPYFPGGIGEFLAEENEFLVFENGPSEDITLQWATYRDASDETSLSRIWGGIHPPADDIPGRLIGIEIGTDAFNTAEIYFFRDEDDDGFNVLEDCDDTNAEINPDATEIANNEVDEDCDGVALIIDEDSDGFNSDEDCDDANAEINPDATEIPNNEVDEDCDGVALIIDEDSDGFNSDEDCDDTNAEVNPDATEIANNEVDEDCDGVALIIDEDSDGFNSDEDCDDGNAEINPDATEIPNNGIDEDCDGQDLVSSLKNLIFEQQFHIFPNPFEEKLIIQCDCIASIQYSLFNYSGQKIEVSGITNINNGQIEIRMSELVTGLYLLKIQDEKGVSFFNKKLIKI